uniref:Reverse transcriptase domain-containing protein n=1 Tax=Schistocephalus solidus TaxID=70667 RepID=A0A183T0A0_SCHSO
LKLNGTKSPGPDVIPAKLLKELAVELAEPLCLHFQASLAAGYLPPNWKTAWIFPIHKSGNRASANNYKLKAFDSVPHQRLLYKLNHIWVRGKLLKKIEHILIGRSQRVRLDDQQSVEVVVENGVPKGIVFGPILFLMYIYYCVTGLDCDIAMFADDIKLWKVIHNEADKANLQENLHRLVEWSHTWLLPFNILQLDRTSSGH